MLYSLYVSYISTKKEKKSKDSWIPSKIKNFRRPKGYEEKNAERPKKAFSLRLFNHFSMKRAYSLSAKEVPFIMKNSRKYSCGYFYIRYKDFDKESKSLNPKFAFIASKKEFKKAVERNFVKRRLRESVNIFLNEFPPKAYLFFIQKNTTEVDFKALKAEVAKFVSFLVKNNLGV